MLLFGFVSTSTFQLCVNLLVIKLLMNILSTAIAIRIVVMMTTLELSVYFINIERVLQANAHCCALDADRFAHGQKSQNK